MEAARKVRIQICSGAPPRKDVEVAWGGSQALFWQPPLAPGIPSPYIKMGDGTSLDIDVYIRC